MKDMHSLSHTKWNCKYHVVFAPKYRRKVFYGDKRLEIGSILRQLCEWKGVNILNAEVCPDHVHMLIEIPPKMSVSIFMGYLSGFRLSFFIVLHLLCFILACRRSLHNLFYMVEKCMLAGEFVNKLRNLLVLT